MYLHHEPPSPKVYFFIGEPGKIGYEVLLGGWENTRITLSRGYARVPEYDAGRQSCQPWSHLVSGFHRDHVES